MLPSLSNWKRLYWKLSIWWLCPSLPWLFILNRMRDLTFNWFILHRLWESWFILIPILLRWMILFEPFLCYFLCIISTWHPYPCGVWSKPFDLKCLLIHCHFLIPSRCPVLDHTSPHFHGYTIHRLYISDPISHASLLLLGHVCGFGRYILCGLIEWFLTIIVIE